MNLTVLWISVRADNVYLRMRSPYSLFHFFHLSLQHGGVGTRSPKCPLGSQCEFLFGKGRLRLPMQPWFLEKGNKTLCPLAMLQVFLCMSSSDKEADDVFYRCTFILTVAPVIHNRQSSLSCL